MKLLPKRVLQLGMRRYAIRKLLGRRGRAASWRALGCEIEPDVRIGPGTVIQHPENVRIGAGTAIVRSVRIFAWERVSIGRCCLLNDNIDLLTGTHDLNSRDFPARLTPIVIEDYSWLPYHVTVLPGVTIGRAAVVGTGSVVVTDVPSLAIVGGNPARIIGQRADVGFAYVPARLI